MEKGDETLESGRHLNPVGHRGSITNSGTIATLNPGLTAVITRPIRPLDICQLNRASERSLVSLRSASTIGM